MQYNTHVKDYWQKTFTTKTKHDQDRIMEAAQTRCEIMLGHPIIKDVLGYFESTLDFRFLTSQGYVILVKLPHTLAHEVKTILGTILVSEFKHAIESRPSGSPNFSVFIDEFQNFVSFEDMSTLITQAPKFGVATTLAHHDRYGQLGDNKEITGATASIASKVMFQLTGKDAADFAPEFSKQPPIELRFEDQYVISQSPVWDLLRGHANPDVRAFVNRYIRPIRDRLDDIHGQSETERLIRSDFMDEASLFRIDERIEGIEANRANPRVLRGALRMAGRAVIEARAQTDKLKSLADEALRLRELLRTLSELFVGVMEERIKQGQENFSNALLEVVRYAFMHYDRQLLELYVSLIYGDPKVGRTIPYWFSKYHSIFPDDIRVVEQESVKAYEKEEREHDKLQYEHAEKQISTVVIKSELPQVRAHWMENARKDIADYKERHGGKNLLTEYPPRDLSAKVLAQEDIRHIATLIHLHLGFSMAGLSLTSINELARFCVLLGRPENHIKVRGTQQALKTIQTRTVADMTNEVAIELSELPKYTAYAKILQGHGMWKGKIKTLELKHAPITSEMRREMSGESWVGEIMERHFYEKRTKVEDELRKRQENWRPLLQRFHILFDPPEVPNNPSFRWLPEEQKFVLVDDEPPPPTSVVVKSAESKPEKRAPSPADANKVRSGIVIPESLTVQQDAKRSTDKMANAGLVYQSDFTKPTGWNEEHSDYVKVFRLDGYYHIAVYGARKWAFFDPPSILGDFKAQVDVELNIQSGKTADCGMVFCAEDAGPGGRYFFYAFTIHPSGFYRLHSQSEKEARVVIDWQKTGRIKSGDAKNSLMIERLEKRVTLWINGQVVAITMDSGLRPGHAGMFVRSYKDDLYGEARFRDFRLYEASSPS